VKDKGGGKGFRQQGLRRRCRKQGRRLSRRPFHSPLTEKKKTGEDWGVRGERS